MSRLLLHVFLAEQTDHQQMHREIIGPTNKIASFLFTENSPSISQ